MSDRASDLRRRIDRDRAELTAIENGTWECLGSNPVTPHEVADALEISDQAANNRLAGLVRVGLVVRDRKPDPTGGRQYVYRRRAAPEVEAALAVVAGPKGRPPFPSPGTDKERSDG